MLMNRPKTLSSLWPYLQCYRSIIPAAQRHAGGFSAWVVLTLGQVLAEPLQLQIEQFAEMRAIPIPG